MPVVAAYEKGGFFYRSGKGLSLLVWWSRCLSRGLLLPRQRRMQCRESNQDNLLGCCCDNTNALFNITKCIDVICFIYTKEYKLCTIYVLMGCWALGNGNRFLEAPQLWPCRTRWTPGRANRPLGLSVRWHQKFCLGIVFSFVFKAVQGRCG